MLYKRANNSILTWADNGATLNTGTNTLTSVSETERGEYIIILSNGSLPIELISFEVTSKDNNKVDLNWKTSSEINNKHFEIQRSSNAFDWETIEIINGAGNSNQLINYNSSDNEPLKNISYYRLKQVDFDYNFSYSEIESISIFGLENELSLYPNPSSNIITIENNLSDINFFQVFNSLGQEVTAMIFENRLAKDKYQINIEQLVKGFYFVKVNENMLKFYKE